MSLRDRNIDWLRKHVFRNANQMASFVAATGIAAGTPAITEFGAAGTNFTAVTLNAAGETVSDIIMLPFDMDPGFSFKARIHYSCDSTTAADTFTWLGLYNNAKRAAASVDPATAFDTIFGSANVLSGVADRIGVTSWAVINADKWTRAEIESGYLVSFSFELDATDAALGGTEDVYFIGWEYSYVPQLTRGNGSVRDVDAAA